jgi:hypothetical protein
LVLSAHWGATCPRQGVPTQRFDTRVRTFFQPVHQRTSGNWEEGHVSTPAVRSHTRQTYNQRAAAELRLDLGTSTDIESREGERALHIAAYDDSVDVAELLIARGAEIDPIGRNYDNTPLGGAMHCQSGRMIDLLGRFSRSAWEVGYAGKVDRLRELLAERPERARHR